MAVILNTTAGNLSGNNPTLQKGCCVCGCGGTYIAEKLVGVVSLVKCG